MVVSSMLMGAVLASLTGGTVPYSVCVEIVKGAAKKHIYFNGVVKVMVQFC